MDFRKSMSNGSRLARNPAMALAYARWTLSQKFRGTPPEVRVGSDVLISGFTTFSEFWLRHRGLDAEDLEMIHSVRRALLPEPATAIDIGGNLGMFSLSLAARGFDHVVSCEPIPDTFQRLLGNIRLNPKLGPRIECVNAGVGDHDGTLNFSFSSTCPGQSKIASSVSATSDASLIKCDLMTLATLMNRVGMARVGLVKIDVEGHESSVLRGALPILQSGKVSFIYSEVIPHALNDAGSSLEEFADLISDAKFHPVLPADSPKAQLARVSFKEALTAAADRRNVLFRSDLISTL
jgi:FkbM family methyltransferase